MKNSPIITLEKNELEERSVTEVAIIDIKDNNHKSRFWISVKIEKGRPKILITTRVGEQKEAYARIAGRFNIPIPFGVMDEENKCPACNSDNIKSQSLNTSFPYGEGESQVQIPVTLQVFTCNDCGLEYVDDSAEDEKHEAIHRYLSPK